jgi:multiple sugar transport system substrate-binding protein
VLHPPGLTNATWQEGLDAFKSGQVAMMMNWFAFFPGLYKDPNVGGEKIGFFVNPSAKGKACSSAARASRWSRTRPTATRRCSTSSGSRRPTCREVVGAGRLLVPQGRAAGPGFVKSAPFAKEFLESMDMVMDFWAEPSYAQLLLSMQKRVHDYVVADKGSAKEALTR